MNPQSIRTALGHNRQFVAVVVVVLVVMTLFPGSPGQIFLAGSSSPAPPPTTTTAPPSPVSAPGAGTAPAPLPPPSPAGDDDGPPATDEPPLRMSEVPAFQPQPRDPPPVCDTDDLFAAVHAMRDGASDGLGDLLDAILPGEDPDRGYIPTQALERLVRLATGCEAEPIPENPDLAADYFTQLVVESLLDFTGIIPDTGLDPILFPPELFDVTTLLVDLLNEGQGLLPIGLRDVLGPFADDVRDYCGTAELLLTLAPILVVQSAPLDRAQLTRLMGPVAGICSLFDDDSFLDESP